jgi:hypothetical protein
MKVKDYRKQNKLELFNRLGKLKAKKIQLIESGEPIYKLMHIVRECEKLKRYLYECQFCADATFGIYECNGEEVEYMVADCGKECQYHEYFYNKALGKKSKVDELLDKWLGGLKCRTVKR